MSNRRILLLAALLGVALAARVGYGLRVHSSGAWTDNIDDYGALARNLAAEGRYIAVAGDGPCITREPGFAMLLAAADFAVGPGFGATLAVLCLFNLALIVLLWKMGSEYLGEKAGWFAAGLAAVYPYYVYYSVHPYREVVYAFFTTLCVWAWLRWLKNPTPAGLAGAGALNGWTCLISFTHFPTAVLSGAFALWAAGRERRYSRAALYFLPLILVYGLWPLRTGLHYRAFVISTPYAALNVYTSMVIAPELKGTQAEADITSRDAALARFEALRHQAPHEAYEFLLAEARARVAAQPGLYVRRVFQNMVKLWRLYPYPRDYGHSYGSIKWVSLASEGLLLPLGLLGLWLWVRRGGRDFAALAAIHIFSLTAVHSLAFAVMRHRLPLMSWLLLFSAYALARVPEAWSRTQD